MVDNTPVPELSTTNLFYPRWAVQGTPLGFRVAQGTADPNPDAVTLANRCVQMGLPGPFMFCTTGYGQGWYLEYENHSHRLSIHPSYEKPHGTWRPMRVTLEALPGCRGTFHGYGEKALAFLAGYRQSLLA